MPDKNTPWTCLPDQGLIMYRPVEAIRVGQIRQPKGNYRVTISFIGVIMWNKIPAWRMIFLFFLLSFSFLPSLFYFSHLHVGRNPFGWGYDECLILRGVLGNMFFGGEFEKSLFPWQSPPANWTERWKHHHGRDNRYLRIVIVTTLSTHNYLHYIIFTPLSLSLPQKIPKQQARKARRCDLKLSPTDWLTDKGRC